MISFSVPNSLNLLCYAPYIHTSFSRKSELESLTPKAYRCFFQILLRYTRFPFGLFRSKSYVVGSFIYNGKDEHPRIITI